METELLRRAQAADAVVVFLWQDYSENSETMDRNHMQIEPYYEHILRVCDRVSQRVIVRCLMWAARCLRRAGSITRTRFWSAGWAARGWDARWPKRYAAKTTLPASWLKPFPKGSRIC